MKALALFLALTLPSSAARIELVAGGGAKVQDAPATECALLEPFGVEFNPAGEMVIVEMTKGQRVLKVDRQGMLRVIGGTGAKGYSGDGGSATAATFNGIHNLAIEADGDLLLSDSFNHTLRKVDHATGVVTTLAGNGASGFAGDGGPAKAAQFSTLIHIALDPAGKNLYGADIGNKRVRRIDLAKGTIETVAGNGKSGVPPDGADAMSAPLADPRAAVADGAGGFYILERNGNALRHVDAAGKIRRYTPRDGKITRVAGTGKRGAAGVGGDPLQCELARPHGVTIAPDGTLYITDSYNDRILRIVR
jgi:DNA-binding beta-propeller fold protein YncE